MAPYTLKAFVEGQEREYFSGDVSSAEIAFAASERLLKDKRIEEVTIKRNGTGLYITLTARSEKDVDEVLSILKVR